MGQSKTSERSGLLVTFFEWQQKSSPDCLRASKYHSHRTFEQLLHSHPLADFFPAEFHGMENIY
jgi:hypothetical protein